MSSSVSSSINLEKYRQFIHAAKTNAIDQLAIILKEFPNFLNHPDAKGNTALHHAAEHDKMQAVQWLVAEKANVNLKNDRSYTPLGRAISQGHIGVVAFLAPRLDTSILGKEMSVNPAKGAEMIYDILQKEMQSRIHSPKKDAVRVATLLTSAQQNEVENLVKLIAAKASTSIPIKKPEEKSPPSTLPVEKKPVEVYHPVEQSVSEIKFTHSQLRKQKRAAKEINKEAERKVEREVKDESVAPVTISLNSREKRKIERAKLHKAEQHEPVAPEAPPLTSAQIKKLEKRLQKANLIAQIEEGKKTSVPIPRSEDEKSLATGKCIARPNPYSSNSYGLYRLFVFKNECLHAKQEHQHQGQLNGRRSVSFN